MLIYEYCLKTQTNGIFVIVDVYTVQFGIKDIRAFMGPVNCKITIV